MSYLFKQKFNISELVDLPVAVRRVLVVEPGLDLAGLYRQYLREEDYFVRHCAAHSDAQAAISEFAPHAVIFNADTSAYGGVVVEILQKIMAAFPALPVVTVSFDADAELLKQVLSCGAASHIDRRSTRPQDVVHVLRAILNN